MSPVLAAHQWDVILGGDLLVALLGERDLVLTIDFDHLHRMPVNAAVFVQIVEIGVGRRGSGAHDVSHRAGDAPHIADLDWLCGGGGATLNGGSRPGCMRNQ